MKKNAHAKIRLGLIGCGGVTEQRHLPALRCVREFEVKALADNDSARLERVARRFGVSRVYSDYRELIESALIDAVAVCVPPKLHTLVARGALEAGKHVLIEKPLALSLSECDLLSESSEAHGGLKVMLGFNLRWHRLIREAREIINRGELGEIKLVRTVFTSGVRLGADFAEWRRRRESGGGALFELGVHHFDVVRFLLGCEPLEIYATSAGNDETATIIMRMESGTQVVNAFSEGTGENHAIEVYGEDGWLRVNCYRADGLERFGGAMYPGALGTRARKLKETFLDLPRMVRQSLTGGDYVASYAEEWRHFARAIMDDSTVECGILDGRRALEIALAAMEASATKRAVSLEKVEATSEAAEAWQLRATSSRHRRKKLLEMSFEEEMNSPGDEEREAEGKSPAMSVVVITPDCYATIRKTIKHLRAQKVCGSLEVLLVAPSAAMLDLEASEMRDFLRHKIVEVGPVSSTARARAMGVREATAPVVAFAEDHAYPAQGWAEALIRRHQEDWAAVGPVMSNANPRSITSWANLLIEYAPWLEPSSGGEREHLPGHNGSYKRELLLKYGDRLEAMLDSESILHWDLRATGHRLYLEAKARTFHQNFSAKTPSLTLRFNGGRLFASARARDWPMWRRALFAFASPLIPVVRCLRITRELFRPGRPLHLFPRVLPALFVGLVFDGAGEMTGYAFGPGEAMAKLSGMEFHRERFMAGPDKLLARGE